MTVGGADADAAVATCADSKMLPAACCALLSARNNISDPTRLMLVVLDATDGDTAAVESFTRRHGVDIEVIAFESERLPAAAKGRWPRAVLTRLFLDEIVPTAMRRLLYIDADTLTVDCLDALMSTELADNCVAAVDDYIMAFPGKLAARRTALGLPDDSPYFNSGVILFDWQASCAQDALRSARRKLAENLGSYHATDQDALNSALNGRWKRLHPRWNAQTGFLDSISDPAIIHFTGRRKPWQGNASWKHRGHHSTYRTWLKDTDWESGNNAPKRASPISSFLLYQAKRVEGFRRARRVNAYLKKHWERQPSRIER